jgi:hypothetical protein
MANRCAGIVHSPRMPVRIDCQNRLIPDDLMRVTGM